MKPELSEYLRERRKELTRQKELVKQGHYDVEEQILREHVKKVYSGSTATSILYESDNIAIIGLSHQELFHNETSGRGYYTASRRVLDKIVCLYSTDGKEQICTYVLFVEEKDYGICFDKSCFGESSKTFLSEVNCLKLPELASFILRCCERGEGTCFEDVEPYLKRLVAFRAI